MTGPGEQTPTRDPRAGQGRAGLARELATRAADTFFALGALALVEVLVVGALSWSRFAGPYELGRAVNRLGPLALAAAAPCAAAGGALAAVVVRGGERGGRFALAALAAASGALVGAGVTTGRHFEDPARRGAFVLVLTAVSGALAYFAAPPSRAPSTARAARPSPPRSPSP